MRAARTRFRFEEYVQLEETSSVKHEFFDGEVYAMAGGSPEHAALAARLALSIGLAAKGRGCEVFSSDLRVRVPASGLTTYPDLTVVCGPWKRDPQDPKAVQNPSLLVEVLSESTAGYDRGEKLSQYQQIDALREVLLVAHDSARLELWRRGQNDVWALIVASAGEVLTLESVGATIDVAELFRGLL